MTKKRADNKMDRNVKAKWVAALRSKKYKQTKNKLKDNNGFCCLGVLCDIYSKETGTEWEGEGYSPRKILGKEGELPLKVLRWAGMKRTLDMGFTFIIDGEEYNLASLNDDENYGFKKIAHLIEDRIIGV